MKSATTVFSWTNNKGIFSDSEFRRTALQAVKENQLQLFVIGNYAKGLTVDGRISELDTERESIAAEIKTARAERDDQKVSALGERSRALGGEKDFMYQAKGINLVLCTEDDLLIPADAKEVMVLSQNLDPAKIAAKPANKEHAIKTYSSADFTLQTKNRFLASFANDVSEYRRTFEPSKTAMPRALADLNYYLNGAKFFMTTLDNNTTAVIPFADPAKGLATFSSSVFVTADMLTSHGVPHHVTKVKGQSYLVLQIHTDAAQKAIKAVYDTEVYPKQPSSFNPLFQLGYAR
jgi:hypothetical protein